MNVTINTPTAPGYSTIAGAVSGLVLWILQTYAFHAAVPGAVETACLIVIPAAVTGISSLFTRHRAAPAPGGAAGK